MMNPEYDPIYLLFKPVVDLIKKNHDNRMKTYIQTIYDIYPLKLRVLGFPDSGKTQFLNALRGIENGQTKKQTIGVQDIPEFRFLHNGYKLRIHAKDINGSREFLVKETKEFTEEASFLFLLVNIVDYLTDKDNCRVEIQRVLNTIFTVSSKISAKPFFAVVFTHADLLNTIQYTPDTAIEEYKKSVADRPYHVFPCYTVNTNNQEDVRQLYTIFLSNNVETYANYYRSHLN